MKLKMLNKLCKYIKIIYYKCITIALVLNLIILSLKFTVDYKILNYFYNSFTITPYYNEYLIYKFIRIFIKKNSKFIIFLEKFYLDLKILIFLNKLYLNI